MKKDNDVIRKPIIYLLFLILLVVNICRAQEIEVEKKETVNNSKTTNKEEKSGIYEGFRGIKWRTKKEDIKGLTEYKSTENKGTNHFTRNGEKMTIGKAKLDKIVYGFDNDKFISVSIWVKGEFNYNELKKVIFDRFGEQKSLLNFESFIWDYDDGNKKIRFWLNYNKTDEIGLFIMFLDKSNREERKEIFRASEEDF